MNTLWVASRQNSLLRSRCIPAGRAVSCWTHLRQRVHASKQLPLLPNSPAGLKALQCPARRGAAHA